MASLSESRPVPAPVEPERPASGDRACFADMPLAENTRRHVGLKFEQLVAALTVLLTAPNWTALTVCELNPDHGASDGSTLRTFVAALSDAIARK